MSCRAFKIVDFLTKPFSMKDPVVYGGAIKITFLIIQKSLLCNNNKE